MRCSGTSWIRVRWHAVLFAAGLLAGWVPGGEPEPASAQIFKGSRVFPGAHGSAQSFASQVRPYFAIMGEVRYPQTYELPPPSPTLVEFIRNCGGFTPNASGQIRIVRNGRVVLQVFHSEQLSVRLLPGDLVIADAKPDAPTNGPATGPAASGVRVALIGVLDYPFVMIAPSDRATVSWIVRQLGQPDMAAQAPKALLPRHGSQVSPDALLPDNSVVVFDSGSIDPTRLPSGLPQPFRVGQEPSSPQSLGPVPPLAQAAPVPNSIQQPQMVPRQGAAPAMIAPPLSQLPATGSVALDPERVDLPVGRARLSDVPSGATRNGRPVQRTPGAEEPNRLLPPTAAAVAKVQTGPTGENELPDTANALPPPQRTTQQTTPPVVERNESGSSAAGSLSDASEASDAGAPSLALQAAGGTNLPSDATTAGSPKVPSAKTISSTRSNPANRIGAFIAPVMVVAILAAWLVFARIRLTAARKLRPQPARGRATLDLLIRNEFPIREEHVQLPRQIQIHGRPVDVPRQRCDAAEPAVPRPHFAASVRQAPVPVATSERAGAHSAARRTGNPQTPQPELPVASDSKVARGNLSRVAVGQLTDMQSSTEPVTRQSAAGSSRNVKTPDAGTVRVRVDQPRPVPPPAHTSEAQSARGDAARTVVPSRVISEGADIVDRALAAMEGDQR